MPSSCAACSARTSEATRAQRIALNRWYEWAESDGGQRLAAATQALQDPTSDVLALLTEIDRVVLPLPSDGREQVLPLLDQYAALLR